MSQQITGYRTDAVNINTPAEGHFAIFQDAITGLISTKPHDNPNNITPIGGEVLVANSGIAQLLNGTVTVPFPRITSNSLIFLTQKTKNGQAPKAVSWVVVPSVSFTIDSEDNTDTHEVAWLVIIK